MMRPTEAQRQAAIIAHAYARLQDYFQRLTGGRRVPPSMEVLIEEYRHHPTATLEQIIVKHTAELR